MNCCVWLVKLKFTFIFLILIINAYTNPTSIIGEDNRTEIKDISPGLKNLAKGVCLIIPRKDISISNDKINILYTRTLKDYMRIVYKIDKTNISSDIKYIDQPYLPKAFTGFLIKDKYVLTAAHAVKEMIMKIFSLGEHQWNFSIYSTSQYIGELAFVFGGYWKDSDGFEQTNNGSKKYITLDKSYTSVYYGNIIPKNGVEYNTTNVKINGIDYKSAKEDWCVIELAEEVDIAKYPPIKIDHNREIIGSLDYNCETDISNDKFFVLGHPKGLPMKFASSEYIGWTYGYKGVKQKYLFFLSDLMTGNSGSPLIVKHANEYIAAGIVTGNPLSMENHTLLNELSLKIENNKIVTNYLAMPSLDDFCDDMYYFGPNAFSTNKIDKSFFPSGGDDPPPPLPTKKITAWIEANFGTGAAGIYVYNKVKVGPNESVIYKYNVAGQLIEVTPEGQSSSNSPVAYTDHLENIFVEGTQYDPNEEEIGLIYIYWDYDNNIDLKTTIGNTSIPSQWFGKTLSYAYSNPGPKRIKIIKRVGGYWVPWYDATHNIVEPNAQEIANHMVYIPPKYENNVVSISPFYMGRTEVAQGEYYDLMNKNPFENYHIFSAGQPAENVTYYDAILFCNARSIAEGLTPVYSYTGTPEYDATGMWCTKLNNLTQNLQNDGFRLPSEDEWKHAYKGGVDLNDGNHTNGYYWNDGEDIGLYACYGNNSDPDGDGEKQSQHVAQYKPNGYGLYDMAGNIREWVWSNSSDVASAYGGGYTQTVGLHVNHKATSQKDGIWEVVGFRVVRNAPPPPTIDTVYSEQNGKPGIVRFKIESTGYIGKIYWDFGDGEYSNLLDPLHEYSKPGKYTVTVVVYGTGGGNCVKKFTINVKADITPILNLLLLD